MNILLAKQGIAALLFTILLGGAVVLNKARFPGVLGGPTADLVMTSTGSSVDFSMNTSKVKDTQIDGIQIVAKISADSERTYTFTPESIAGLQPLLTTVEKENDIYTLRVVYLSDPPDRPFTITSDQLALGKFSVNDTDGGTIVIEPNQTLTKSIIHGKDRSILKVGKPFSFSPTQ